MDESEALDALTALGLSTYAAETFLGLQKLGAASASEVAQVTDVPRSQVYGATDELEDRGLVDIQEGSPRRYRPIAIEEARDLLYSRLRARGDAAFEYLEAVREEHDARPEEGREAIWTTEGRDNVTARVTSLLADADDHVLFATSDPDLIAGEVTTALAAAADRGVEVTVASAEPAVQDHAEAADLLVLTVDDDPDAAPSVGRVVTIDGDTVLLSVVPPAEMPHVAEESAFWSAGTGFATILSGLVAEQFG